jgi:hypothetical protein
MAEDEEKQSFLSDGCETFTDFGFIRFVRPCLLGKPAFSDAAFISVSIAAVGVL